MSEKVKNIKDSRGEKFVEVGVSDEGRLNTEILVVFFVLEFVQLVQG